MKSSNIKGNIKDNNVLFFFCAFFLFPYYAAASTDFTEELERISEDSGDKLHLQDLFDGQTSETGQVVAARLLQEHQVV